MLSPGFTCTPFASVTLARIDEGVAEVVLQAPPRCSLHAHLHALAPCSGDVLEEAGARGLRLREQDVVVDVGAEERKAPWSASPSCNAPRAPNS